MNHGLEAYPAPSSAQLAVSGYTGYYPASEGPTSLSPFWCAYDYHRPPRHTLHRTLHPLRVDTEAAAPSLLCVLSSSSARSSGGIAG